MSSLSTIVDEKRSVLLLSNACYISRAQVRSADESMFGVVSVEVLKIRKLTKTDFLNYCNVSLSLAPPQTRAENYFIV